MAGKGRSLASPAGHARLAIRAALLSLSALASVLAPAQITPIPWSPKGSPAPESGPSKPGDAKAAEPAPAPRFKMTFDRLTTLEDGVHVAEGNVRFVHPELLLTADSVTYDANKETLWATGGVAVDFRDFTITGSELRYDLKAGTGVVLDAYGVQRNGEFTVTAREIRRTSPDWYEMVDGVFTSCAAAVPPWSMKVSSGRFHVDHYAFLRNPRFRVRNAPIVYIPYLVWPLKPERSTGMLIPEIGGSSNKGLTVSNALFLAPSDWWDDTIYLDYYEREGFGIGEEFRYALTPRDYGWFHGYYIDQESDGRRRWSLQGTHIQTFRKGWRLLLDLNLLSDINFLRDYQRDFVKATVAGTDSKLVIQREWGPYHFNAKAERRVEYFWDAVGEGDLRLVQKAAPEIELRSGLQPLGGGLYFGFETSAAHLQKEWAEGEGDAFSARSLSYGRLDLHPFIEWPRHPAPWLDLTPRLELRATGYSKGLEDGDGEGSVWRNYLRGSLDLAGPRLSRTFGGGTRHVIEPFAQYRYLTAGGESGQVPLFDEIDIAAFSHNRFRLGVRNRLYDKEGELRGEAEIYSDYSLKGEISTLGENTSRLSPVTLLARVWPVKSFSADLRLRYNTLARAIDSRSLSITYRPPKALSEDFLRLTYQKTNLYGTSRTQALTSNPASEEARVASSITMADGRVTLNAFLDRDIGQGRWRNQRGIFWYHGSCYSLGFEGGRREIGFVRESSFRFLVSLKGAGTVVDLQGGTETVRD